MTTQFDGQFVFNWGLVAASAIKTLIHEDNPALVIVNHFLINNVVTDKGVTATTNFVDQEGA